MGFRWICLAVLLLIVPSSASAAVKIRFSNTIYTVGTTAPIEGYVCIFAEVTDASPPALAGYQIVLDMTPALKGITFTGVENTSALLGYPPIFPSSSPQLFQNTGFSIKMDNFLTSGSRTLTDGAGLARINFTIDPGTSQTFTLTLDQDPGVGTLLVDANGDPVAYTTEPGTITVDVPEPSFLTLVVVPALLFLRRTHPRAMSFPTV